MNLTWIVPMADAKPCIPKGSAILDIFEPWQYVVTESLRQCMSIHSLWPIASISYYCAGVHLLHKLDINDLTRHVNHNSNRRINTDFRWEWCPLLAGDDNLYILSKHLITLWSLIIWPSLRIKELQFVPFLKKQSSIFQIRQHEILKPPRFIFIFRILRLHVYNACL